jgi:glycosyltransferase involved in cell wall biosynthesis
MAGFDAATGDILITMDGDLQNDPGDIPAFLARINEGFDLVTGWRKKRKDNVLLRIIPSVTANFIISKVLKTNIHDYGCTLKAYRKDITKNMRLYGEMHRFIPAIANWRGAKITEIETNHRPRKYGKTKYGLNRTVKIILDLLLMAFLSEYSTKPLRFFGGIGLASSFLGTLLLLVVIYMKIFSNVDMTGNPLLILSVLFFLVSIQLISLGFLGEINIRTYYETQNKKTYYINEIIG